MFKSLFAGIVAIVSLSGCSPILRGQVLLDSLPKSWFCELTVTSVSIYQQEYSKRINIKVDKNVLYIYDGHSDTIHTHQISLKEFCN